MAPAKRPSTLAKLKTRDSVSPTIDPELDSFYVTGTTPALAPPAAAPGTLKLTITARDSENNMDSLVDNEEEEICQTPKLQEHKIPPALCCPPAPFKRRSNPVMRKLPTRPLEGFYILSDSDIQSLFGSGFATRKVVRKCRK